MMITSYFYVFLWSITPLVELRASIPLGFFKFELSIYESVFISVLGGMFVAFVLLLILPFCIKIIEQYIPILQKPLHKILSKTQQKHSEKIQTLGEFFLVILVAIPLPGSGAFTGSLVAYIFGIKFIRAFTLISIGIIFSGIIVGILTLFGEQIWNFVLELI